MRQYEASRETFVKDSKVREGFSANIPTELSCAGTKMRWNDRGLRVGKALRKERDVLDLINVNLINFSDAPHSSSLAAGTAVAGLPARHQQSHFSANVGVIPLVLRALKVHN